MMSYHAYCAHCGAPERAGFKFRYECGSRFCPEKPSSSLVSKQCLRNQLYNANNRTGKAEMVFYETLRGMGVPFDRIEELWDGGDND